MRSLLFISNLFPDTREPYRGLDNATVLHHLADRWEIRAIGLRPALPWQRRKYEPRSLDTPFQPQFLRVPYLPKIGSRVNHLLMAQALRRQLSQQNCRPDLVLSSWIYPDSCAVARVTQEMRLPFSAIAQGSDVHQYLRVPARRRVILRHLPEAQAVITRSAELARLLKEAGLPAAQLHPIYNGVDRSIFHPDDRTAARLALGLPMEAPLVLFVGNFYAIKNPLTLLKAHALLTSQQGLEDSQLMLVGGGELEPQMKALAAQSGTTSLVHFSGRQDAAGVALRMQAADVLCLPSDNEGVPNVILEAFTCGLPVVASRVGGIPEVHTSEALGRLAPPRDPAALAEALGEVLRQPPSREAIVDHASQFTWERAADRYHELLEASLTPSASQPLASARR
ncbi:MAG: glycosyltransferase family 4 protein [Verrucomicrobiaceae bacterium]|nr:MAG: glycosyltransferase family 4 protein [Verrucomicrobiaceae bacterium]